MRDLALLIRKSIFEQVALKVKGKVHVNVDLTNEVILITIEHRGIHFSYNYSTDVVKQLQAKTLTTTVVDDCLRQYRRLINSLYFHEPGFVPSWYGKEVE